MPTSLTRVPPCGVCDAHHQGKAVKAVEQQMAKQADRAMIGQVRLMLNKFGAKIKQSIHSAGAQPAASESSPTEAPHTWDIGTHPSGRGRASRAVEGPSPDCALSAPGPLPQWPCHRLHTQVGLA